MQRLFHLNTRNEYKTKQSLPEASPISQQEDHNLGQKELTPMPGEYKHSDKHEKLHKELAAL